MQTRGQSIMSSKAKFITLVCGLIGLVSGILGIIQFIEDRKSDQNEKTIQILLKQLQQVQNLSKENENRGKTIKDLLDHQKKLYQLIEKEFNSKSVKGNHIPHYQGNHIPHLHRWFSVNIKRLKIKVKRFAIWA
jgi:hypothetical protein